MYQLSNTITIIYNIYSFGKCTYSQVFSVILFIFTCQNFVGASILVIRYSNDIMVLNEFNVFIFFAC